MMKKHIVIGLLATTILSGCKSVNVNSVPASENLSNVCIQKNSFVKAKDIVPVVEHGFARHGIKTELLSKDANYDHCSHTLTYESQRMWDIVFYMFHTELYLHDKSGQEIGSAIYHLKAGGGADLNKYRSTETKMKPVMDEFLKHYPLLADNKKHLPSKSHANRPTGLGGETVSIG